MTSPLPPNEPTTEIDREYAAFLDRLESLKKEQDDLIREYRKKLELRKMQHLREQLTKD